MLGSSIRHWFQHLKCSTQDYTDACEIGLRSSNLQYAAYAFGHNMYCRFYQGAPLATLIQESQRSLDFSRTRLNQWAIDLLEGGLSIFHALSSESPALSEPDAWSEEYLRRVEEHHNLQVTCIYKVLKTCSLLVLGSYDRALQLSDEAESLIYTVGTQGLLPWPEHVFARLLILTALYAKADDERQAHWRPELDRLLHRLRIWADNCPDNFQHKYWLAAAELARLDGRPVAAMRLYDQAVEAAQAGDFLQWEGLANERAYGFWLERGNAGTRVWRRFTGSRLMFVMTAGVLWPRCARWKRTTGRIWRTRWPAVIDPAHRWSPGNRSSGLPCWRNSSTNFAIMPPKCSKPNCAWRPPLRPRSWPMPRNGCAWRLASGSG
ncbi:MAG: hypothetical protein NTY19_15600 [Planctomycetota bacterium]|nr:hypothetical protein [Planctomycetota bacterium]